MHILARLRFLAAGKVDSDVLEDALVLVVLISIVSVGTAVLSQSVELARKYTIQLVFAAVAIALCLVERGYGSSTENANPAVVTELTATPRGAPSYTPFR